jgi:hypothetical protein
VAELVKDHEPARMKRRARAELIADKMLALVAYRTLVLADRCAEPRWANDQRARLAELVDQQDLTRPEGPQGFDEIALVMVEPLRRREARAGKETLA